MDTIIQDVTGLNQFLLSKIHSAVECALERAGVSTSLVPQLSEIFGHDGPFGRPFHGLESAHQQLQYCKSNLGLVVS